MRLFARLSTCVLLCLSPALLGHCGGATNEGLMGTETGNPPVVDSHKLRLVASATGVELIAQAGAVSAGAQVRLDNRSSGASAQVTAEPDGSFRLDVLGTELDTYEVTVTVQGKSTSVQLTLSARDGGPDDSDPSNLSCEQLEASLGPALSSAFAPFATGCTSDSDCVIQYWGSDCYERCGASYVLATQMESAALAAEQSIEPYCSEIERRGCVRPAAPTCAPARPIECRQGTCQALDLTLLSCEQLEARAGTLVNQTSDNVNRSCNVDADCTFVMMPTVSCISTCGYRNVINVADEQSLPARFASIESEVCGAFRDRGCTPPPLPPCLPPPETTRVSCVQNLCTVEEVP